MKALFGKKQVAKKVVPVTTVPSPKKKAVVKKVAAKKVVAKKAVAKKVPAKKALGTATAAKKAPAKKVTPAKQRFVVASDSESFWVHDGQVLNSLIALEVALGTMKPSVYAYHVTAEGNHFADWVEAVLGEAACAHALRSAKTVSAARKVVVLHTKSYSA